MYCEKAIRTLLKTEKEGKQPKKQNKDWMPEPVKRKFKEGKIVVQGEWQ